MSNTEKKLYAIVELIGLLDDDPQYARLVNDLSDLQDELAVEFNEEETA